MSGGKRKATSQQFTLQGDEWEEAVTEDIGEAASEDVDDEEVQSSSSLSDQKKKSTKKVTRHMGSVLVQIYAYTGGAQETPETPEEPI
jgi:hypothetical protein